jgi:hypothetical protein
MPKAVTLQCRKRKTGNASPKNVTRQGRIRIAKTLMRQGMKSKAENRQVTRQ